MLSDRFSAVTKAPHFELSQFWAVAEQKGHVRRDTCCVCSSDIDPLERELDGSTKKGKDGSWVLANNGITAFGARCKNCRDNKRRVFYPGVNINNIRIDADGNIKFAILIDSAWQEAEYLVTDSFATTINKIYRPDPANNPRDVRRANIYISREELRALAANTKK